MQDSHKTVVEPIFCKFRYEFFPRYECFFESFISHQFCRQTDTDFSRLVIQFQETGGFIVELFNF